jgi:hypothetical protein
VLTFCKNADKSRNLVTIDANSCGGSKIVLDAGHSLVLALDVFGAPTKLHGKVAEATTPVPGLASTALFDL